MPCLIFTAFSAGADGQYSPRRQWRSQAADSGSVGHALWVVFLAGRGFTSTSPRLDTAAHPGPTAPRGSDSRGQLAS